MLWVKAVKFFMDGALGSWGAAMLEPYSDRPDLSGYLRWDEDDYVSNATAWAHAGFHVATHAIGDRANRLVLDTYHTLCEEKRGATGAAPDLRLRIEHFQIVNETDIPRVVVQGSKKGSACILASMQPDHAVNDMGFAEHRVGAERLKGSYAWQSVLDAGAQVLAFGSDWPTAGKPPPLQGIYHAVTRQDFDGLPKGGWTPSQRVSRYDAVRGYTLDNAFAAFQEEDLGSITEGKFADWVALDRDILDERVDADLIWQTAVLGTYVGGREVWRHPTCWGRVPCPEKPRAPPRRRPGDGCPH